MAKEDWEEYFDAVRNQDWITAGNILQIVSKQDRDNPQIFIKIGDICQRTADKKGAIEAYSRAAQLLRMQGFAQKALATYKIALRLDPANPEIISRAEILMDEFEAARTRPHMPGPAKQPSGVLERPPQPEKEALPQTEAEQPPDWLERTAVSQDISEEQTSVSVALPDDNPSFLESTSLSPDLPQPPTQDSPQIQRPEMPSNDEQWLASAYDALDTRVFKVHDDDSIDRIPGQKPAEPDKEISEAMQEFLLPLSERRQKEMPEIFQELPEAVVANFMSELTVRKYSDKQPVIEEGDSGDSMYIIRSGSARVISHILGRQLELGVLGRGDLFGEVGFLTGRPRTAAVNADGPLEVYEISRPAIEKLIETNPEIIARLEGVYETRIRETIRIIKS